MFENSTQIIGIVMMAVAFVGVIICAKKDIQVGALGGLLIVLGGAVIYGVGTFSDDSSGAEIGHVYYCSITDRAGKEMKNHAAGKKIVYLVDPGMMQSEIARKGLETFKKAFGSDDVELATIDVPPEAIEQGLDMTTYLKPKHIDDIISRDPDAAFVIEIGFPERADRIAALKLPEAKRPIVFLTNSGAASGKVISKMIKDGKIAGVVIGKPGKRDPNYEPDADKLAEAFDKLYVVVNKDNYNEFKNSFE